MVCHQDVKQLSLSLSAHSFLQQRTRDKQFEFILNIYQGNKFIKHFQDQGEWSWFSSKQDSWFA